MGVKYVHVKTLVHLKAITLVCKPKIISQLTLLSTVLVGCIFSPKQKPNMGQKNDVLAHLFLAA